MSRAARFLIAIVLSAAASIVLWSTAPSRHLQLTGVEAAGEMCIPASGTLGWLYGGPREGDGGTHNGIDIWGQAGVTPIYAAASGTASIINTTWGGTYVRIHHTHLGNVWSFYDHMGAGNIVVSSGQQVTKGQHIGYIGTDHANGVAHVHFAVNVTTSGNETNNNVDPSPYLGVDLTYPRPPPAWQASISSNCTPVPPLTATITSPQPNETFSTSMPLSVSASGGVGGPARFEFGAHYSDNPGVATPYWHQVGHATPANGWTVHWNVSGVPEQSGVIIHGWIVDSAGNRHNNVIGIPGLSIRRDADGDGVPDNVDACPTQPEDVDGVGDGDGCFDPFVSTAADFNGDGVTDYTVYRPNTGEWYIRDQATIQYGASGDVPVAGYYNNDAVADIAVWRPTTGMWYIRTTEFPQPVQYGLLGDIPVPGFYNNDGIMDLAVWRPSTQQWFIRAGEFPSPIQYGQAGDVPVPADYDGDLITDLAVWRPSTGEWFINFGSPFVLGTAGDIPVPGDYFREFRAATVTYRPTTSLWILPPVGNATAVGNGASPGDVPVPGQFETPAKVSTSLMQWNPSTGNWYRFVNVPPVQWGLPGDIPVNGLLDRIAACRSDLYACPDSDADAVKDSLDNCPTVRNTDQFNSDGNFIDNSPPYAASADDRTNPVSDRTGDVCDADDDNDGFPESYEISGEFCGGVPTDPMRADSDGDRFVDSAECALGSNPMDAAASPPITSCGSVGDYDGDRIPDRNEFCFYNTNASLVDTDGDAALDGGKDGCEIVSFNGDTVVSSGDQGMLGAGIVGTVAYHANIDVNKDGVLNSGDQGLQASLIVPPDQCP